jgi:uncharacterized membrane protein YphA (DoxX/SURF4 family)
VDNQGAELFARLLVGSVLVLAGVMKLMSPKDLARDVAAYRLVPLNISLPLGIALAACEVGAGLLLWVGLWVAVVAGLSAVLLATFLLVALSAVARKLNVNCGCFGLLYRQKIGKSVFARDTLLMVLALYTLQAGEDRISLSTMGSTLDFGEAIYFGLGMLFLLALVLMAKSMRSRAYPMGF